MHQLKCFWIQVTKNSAHNAFNMNENFLAQVNEMPIGNYDPGGGGGELFGSSNDSYIIHSLT